jgi:hypothetical protein
MQENTRAHVVAVEDRGLKHTNAQRLKRVLWSDVLLTLNGMSESWKGFHIILPPTNILQ